MREIEFRGKSKYDNEWVYGFYSPLIRYPSLEQTPSIKSFKGGDIEINLETLGQYTGLKDKNGTKIFEGDIVKHKINETLNRKPIYIYYCLNYCETERCLRAFKNGIKGYAYEISFASYIIKEKDLEVVGNIYENPEIIEEHRYIYSQIQGE